MSNVIPNMVFSFYAAGRRGLLRKSRRSAGNRQSGTRPVGPDVPPSRQIAKWVCAGRTDVGARDRQRGGSPDAGARDGRGSRCCDVAGRARSCSFVMILGPRAANSRQDFGPILAKPAGAGKKRENGKLQREEVHGVEAGS